nr:hypothetical protein [Tanacetum cinerariifolium]
IKRYIDTKPNHELIHYCLKNPPYNFTWVDKEVPISEGIDNDIYFTVDACSNACEMWKAIERLKHGESINVQDLETNLYWEFGKFTSRDGESPKSYYSRFYKMMNELVRNQCDVTNHQVNVQSFNYNQNGKGAGYENQRIGNVAEARETVEQADWRDDTDDESKDQELEAHYMYMAQIQEVSPDAAASGPIFDAEPLQKIDQNDGDNDLANEQTNALMYNDLKKFKAELNRRNDVEYTSKVEIDCAKAKGDLISYKMESQKSFNKYTQMINDLNQTISEMKKKLSVHQETISILSQAKEAQIKLYKIREDKELDKVIALENKVKVLDNIVYKTSQSVQTMNMLNSKRRTSFAKPEFLKKAQRANPRLYDIDEVTNLQCDSLELLKKCECLEKELSKSIAISELKKLIEKLKGKYVDTKFEKSSVIRQPNAFKSQRPSILGKPTTFSDSLERKDFSKSKSVTKNNVSNDFSKPVTAQILPTNKKSILKNTNVLAPGMYKLHTKPTQTRTS